MGPGQMMGQPATSLANMAQHFQYMPHQGDVLTIFCVSALDIDLEKQQNI
jgi:hypothetical protein